MSETVQLFSFNSPIICNKLRACTLDKDHGLIFHKEELSFDVLNALNESSEEKREPSFFTDKIITFKKIDFDTNQITISLTSSKQE